MRGLSITERVIVRLLRTADRIVIEIPTEEGLVTRVSVTGHKPIHDIAIAVQDFYNNFSHD